MSNLYTQIINKEVPARVIYEDKMFIAFLDSNPNTKGHTILLAKFECESVLELPPQFTAKMMDIAVKIAKKLKEKLFCKGFNFVIDDGEYAGQEIPYISYQIIPRYNKKERLIMRKNHNDNLDKVLNIINN